MRRLTVLFLSDAKDEDVGYKQKMQLALYLANRSGELQTLLHKDTRTKSTCIPFDDEVHADFIIFARDHDVLFDAKKWQVKTAPDVVIYITKDRLKVSEFQNSRPLCFQVIGLDPAESISYTFIHSVLINALRNKLISVLQANRDSKIDTRFCCGLFGSQHGNLPLKLRNALDRVIAAFSNAQFDGQVLNDILKYPQIAQIITSYVKPEYLLISRGDEAVLTHLILALAQELKPLEQQQSMMLETMFAVSAPAVSDSAELVRIGTPVCDFEEQDQVEDTTPLQSPARIGSKA